MECESVCTTGHVDDSIIPESISEDVKIRSATALQVVVTDTASKHITAGTCRHYIIAHATLEDCVSRRADNGVVTVSSPAD